MGTPGETLKGSQTLWEEPGSMEKSIGGKASVRRPQDPVLSLLWKAR
jgi:hypothetical protein